MAGNSTILVPSRRGLKSDPSGSDYVAMGGASLHLRSQVAAHLHDPSSRDLASSRLNYICGSTTRYPSDARLTRPTAPLTRSAPRVARPLAAGWGAHQGARPVQGSPGSFNTPRRVVLRRTGRERPGYTQNAGVGSRRNPSRANDSTNPPQTSRRQRHNLKRTCTPARQQRTPRRG